MIDAEDEFAGTGDIFPDDPYAPLPPLPPLPSAAATVLAALPPPEPALLGPLAPGSITLIRGPRGSGKSWLALAMARAVAAGAALLGWQGRRVPVLHVDAAMAAATLGARLRALGSPPPDLNLIGDRPFDLGAAANQARFMDALPERGLLVLDGLSLLVQPGRRRGGWTEFCTWLRALRQDGLAILLVDHAGRPAVEALADTVITLKPLHDPDRVAVTAAIVSRNALAVADRAFTIRLDLADGAARWSREAAVEPALLEIVEAARAAGTVRDIAARLGLPVATAWRRLGRARALGLIADATPGETDETEIQRAPRARRRRETQDFRVGADFSPPGAVDDEYIAAIARNGHVRASGEAARAG